MLVVRATLAIETTLIARGHFSKNGEKDEPLKNSENVDSFPARKGRRPTASPGP